MSKYRDISQDLISGIYATLSPSLNDKMIFQRVDKIILTLTSGTAIVTNNGLSEILTYTTSKTISATNFVTAYASDYLAVSSILTSIGDTLFFTSLVPGVNFTGNTSITYNLCDYYLPSKDELNKIWVNLLSGTDENSVIYTPIPYVPGVSGYYPNYYWSSTESSGYEATHMDVQSFVDGTRSGGGKSAFFWVLACRKFTSLTNYNLRDNGPCGGYIFYKNGNNYLECPLINQGRSLMNIQDVAVGTTLSSIGSGQSNTTAIINQSGHTYSPAKVCDDLSYGIINTVNAVPVDITYPVYKSIPKEPANEYIYVGGVIQTNDDNKDNFGYTGSVMIKVVTNKKQRGDKKLVGQIMNVARGLLKTSVSSVFSLTTGTLVIFSPESFNDMEEINPDGQVKISFIDLYNFVIN